MRKEVAEFKEKDDHDTILTKKGLVKKESEKARKEAAKDLGE